MTKLSTRRFCLFIFFGAQCLIMQGFNLDSIKHELAVYTSTDYNYNELNFTINFNTNSQFTSNKSLRQTIGIDYRIFTLEYSFGLPINTLRKNSPLSDYYRLSGTFSFGHWRVHGYIGAIRGFFDLSNFRDADLRLFNIDPRYRKDIFTMEAGISAYYFFNKYYRYSLSVNRTYEQNQSGYTFLIGYKPKFHIVATQQNIFDNSTFPFSNGIEELNTVIVLENAFTFGFTGLWTNKKWFVKGMVNMGAALQNQYYVFPNDNATSSNDRFYVSPAFDYKFSIGYKKNAWYFSLDAGSDFLIVDLPQSTQYKHINHTVSLCIGLRIFEFSKLIRDRRH